MIAEEHPDLDENADLAGTGKRRDEFVGAVETMRGLVAQGVLLGGRAEIY